MIKIIIETKSLLHNTHSTKTYLYEMEKVLKEEECLEVYLYHFSAVAAGWEADKLFRASP